MKNLYYDGLADGVRMNGNDAFTFDGVRLIKTDASDKSCIIYESEYGHILDTSNSLIAGESVGTSLSNGLYGALTDSNIDGVTGGVEGGVRAVNPGRYFFSGKYTNRTLIQRAATFSSNANVSRIVGLAIRSY